MLLVGDVVGKPGRKILAAHLPGLVDTRLLDYVIVNIENAAGGFGITPDTLAELDELPIDCYTSGNHIWSKKDGVALLDEDPRLLRPANYPGDNPGSGVYVGETAAGIPVATLNLEGQVFMKPLVSPFAVADELLEELPSEVKVILVDFHAEATSEKQALACYLDGRVSAVVGTHTHVPTADERILEGGTALQTDVGMTGPYDSVIGMRKNKVLRRFLHQTPLPFEVARRDAWLVGVQIDVDPQSGKATAIERIQIRE